VRNEKVLQRAKEERNVVHKKERNVVHKRRRGMSYIKMKDKWICYVLLRNCLLKQLVMEK
jgi:hypothetical protein